MEKSAGAGAGAGSGKCGFAVASADDGSFHAVLVPVTVGLVPVPAPVFEKMLSTKYQKCEKIQQLLASNIINMHFSCVFHVHNDGIMVKLGHYARE